jgi:two-component system, NarL family, nitrate/nitrite response regulator NarL
VRVVLAAEDRLLLEGLRAALEPAADFELVGSTHVPDRVSALVAELKPDLLLLDAELGGIDSGTMLLRVVRAGQPAVAVVLLTDAIDPERASTALLTHGAKGVIEKSADCEAIAPALRAAMRGEAPTVGGPEAQRPGLALGLTRAEESVLLALARGGSNDQIARELRIARSTVKFHLRNAYAKLDVDNRIEALRVLLENAVLGDNPYNWL